MNIKINNKKYEKLDYARLKEFVDNSISQSNYDICLESDKSNWLQIFKENGYVSIAHRVGTKVSKYFKLNDEDKIHDIIKQYFFEGKLIVDQKPDETVNIKDNSILSTIGFIIAVCSFVLLFFTKENTLNFILCFLFFAIGLMISTVKSLINKEYDIRNCGYFFGGVIMFFASLFMLVRILVDK
ncbi:MAG: hypothetical protein J6Y30_01460 [Treponema sp.]|nr:hypothetical protein [Treponema sp.]